MSTTRCDGSSAGTARAFSASEVKAIRQEFPCLQQEVNGKPLVYLDSAATSQKPQTVIDAVREVYEHKCANIHRGVHALSMRATDAYEKARGIVKDFIGARSDREIVFVRGATEGINLIANSFVRPGLNEGDEIVVTHLEHHANIVPWQLVCAERSAKLVVVPVGDQGEVELEDFVAALGPKTRFASFAQVSNALGTVLPTKAMVEACRQRGIPCLVDGAQAVPHLPVNVQDLDCDFFVFSGHKVYAPSGVGALYGRKALLDAMPPWQGGGDMILSVSFEGSRWNAAPFKFEAGTPNIEGAIGLGVALEWLKAKGLDRVAAWEHELLEAANSGLQGIDGVRLIGTAPGKAAVVSFVLDGVHPHDIGTCLDQDGVAIRVGHHCAEPIMHRFGVPATARASFGIYNTMADVEAFVASVGKVQEMFGNV